MTVEIYLIRHGLTQGNLEGRYLGRNENPSLSEQGRRTLSERKSARPYPQTEMLYSSPLLRCIETARIIYPMLVPILLPSLAEQDFGVFEGKTYEQLKDDPAYRRWIGSAGRLAPPGGESGQDFALRLEGALTKIGEDCQKRGAKTAAVITHGGCIMTMLSRLCVHPGPPSSFYDYQAPNGGGFSAALHLDSYRLAPLGSL